MRGVRFLAFVVALGSVAGACVAQEAPVASVELEAALKARQEGRLWDAVGHLEKALTALEAVPPGAATDDVRRDRAFCLQMLGSVYGRLGQPLRRLELTQQALEAYRQLSGTERQQAGCLFNIGSAWGQLGDPRREQEFTEQALALFRTLEGTQREQANCLVSLGWLYGASGQHQREIETMQQALDLFRSIPDTDWEQAVCLQDLAVACGKVGRLADKIALTCQALDLYGQIPDTQLDQAHCWHNLGIAYLAQNQLAAAEEALQRALSLLGNLPGSEREQARCLVSLGLVWGARGQSQRETELYRQAVALHRAALAAGPGQGKEADLAAALCNLGIALIIRGSLQEAETALTQSEALYLNIARTENVPGEPSIPEGLVSVEMSLGKIWRMRGGGRGFAGAAAPAASELAAYRDAPWDCFCRAYRHSARAVHMVEYLRGRAATSPEMRAAYFQSLTWVHDEIIDLLTEMRQRDLPLASDQLGEPDTAFWEDLGFGAEGGPAVPRLWEDWQSWDEAILHYSEAARARVLRDMLAAPAVPLGSEVAQQLWTHLQALRATEDQIAAQVRVAERTDPARLPDLRQRLIATRLQRQRVHSDWAQTALGAVAEARPVRLEEVRGLLRADEALIEYKLLPGQLVACVVTTARTPGPGLTVHTVPVPGGGEGGLFGATQRPSTREHSTEAVDVLSRLQALCLASGQAQGLPAGTPLPLEPPELLRHFSLAELVWLYRYPMTLLGGDEPLGVNEALSWRSQQVRIAAALHQALLRPLMGSLRRAGVRSLVIVPDGALCYLPFEALVSRLPRDLDNAPAGQVFAVSGLEYAGESYRMRYLPSVASYLITRKSAASRPPPLRRLFAIADPVFSAADDRLAPGAARSPEGLCEARAAASGTPLSRLPSTRREAQTALAAFAREGALILEEPGKLRWDRSLALLSLAATEPVVHAPQMSGFGYLLLSTHAIIQPEDPMSSYIAFTDPRALAMAMGANRAGCQAVPSSMDDPRADGKLLLPEVFGLRLNARMVTLSACETAQGGFARGEGILGLTTALFVAGTRGVTASLWKVADEATADLIGGYHQRMAANEEPATALRAARLQMLARARAAYRGDPTSEAARYAHPYYWAPFVLLGE